MITAFFCPPGGGKTTCLSILAQRHLKKIEKGRSPYKHVYTNFPCKGTERISVADLSRYYISNSLILLDEVTLELDSRSWKNTPQGLIEFLILHRHLGCDLIYCVQDWSRCEKSLRELTVALFFLYRSPLPFFNRWVTAKQIFRKLDINEHSSELTLGYRFSDWKDRLFNKAVYRRFYLPSGWKYFDTFDPYGLDRRPELDSRLWFDNNEK